MRSRKGGSSMQDVDRGADESLVGVLECYHFLVRRSSSVVSLVYLLALPASAQLEPSPDEVDPFVFAASVRARGDEPILEALRDPDALGRSARRRAIRAAPDLRDPAAALPALAEIAASREPFDSAAAMHAAFVIVRAMPGDAVERFELDVDMLASVADVLKRLAADATARSSLRVMAGTAEAELRDRLG